MSLNILCLYQDLMNLYGENGNIKVLKYHLDELGIKTKIDYLSIDDKIDFSKYDLVMIGSGTEENRFICLKHLMKYKKDIAKAIDEDKFFLITGNAVALFGKSIYKEKALGVLDLEVTESKDRNVNEVVIPSSFSADIYGTVNHQDDVTNKENNLFENSGVLKNNFYGSYVFGPILSRNPEFLEYFIKELIHSKDKKFKIKKLNLDLDKKAYNEFIEFKKTKVFNVHNS